MRLAEKRVQTVQLTHAHTPTQLTTHTHTQIKSTSEEHFMEQKIKAVSMLCGESSECLRNHLTNLPALTCLCYMNKTVFSLHSCQVKKMMSCCCRFSVMVILRNLNKCNFLSLSLWIKDALQNFCHLPSDAPLLWKRFLFQFKMD